jgi:hypothetical protein
MKRIAETQLLIFPLAIEAQVTLRRLRARAAGRCGVGKRFVAGCESWRIEVLISGPGRRSSESLNRWLELAHAVGAGSKDRGLQITMFGFAGALSGTLSKGQICWFRDCCLQDGSPSLALGGAKAEACDVSLLTSSDVVLRTEQRHLLHDSTQAHAVDMEAYWLASALARQQRSLQCCRVISDDHAEDLPPWVGSLFAARSRWSQWYQAARIAAVQRGGVDWLRQMKRTAEALSSSLADEVDLYLASNRD